MKTAFLLAMILFGCGKAVKDPSVIVSVANCTPMPHADPGPDKTIILGIGTAKWVQIGGQSVGSCLWSPSNGLDEPTKCNPIASPAQTTTYQLIVTTPCGQAGGKVTVNVYAED